MTTAEFYECPGCGASVSPDMKKCEYCDNPLIIHSIGVIRTFSPLQLNKYANSYRKQLAADPDDRELNRSMGICYLKLKLYDKANEAFERAVTDNFEDADSYFYAAVGRLQGKKAFVASLRVSPSWTDELSAARSMGATDADIDALADLLGVPVSL